MAFFAELTKLLEEVLTCVNREDNDFSWSGWKDAQEAVAEFNGLLLGLQERDQESLTRISFLFMPTGPLQELALSSGWGDEFCRLANQGI